MLQHDATRCNTLQQHTATCYNNTLQQHAATRCNTLQHAATRCNTLQEGKTSYELVDLRLVQSAIVVTIHLICMNESCHTWISHVTHMNESCHTCDWVMSHIWMSHVTHINGSCHWMSHVTHMNESCHIYEWVMSHIRMSHVTHMNESWNTWMCHVTRMNECTPVKKNESLGYHITRALFGLLMRWVFGLLSCGSRGLPHHNSVMW